MDGVGLIYVNGYIVFVDILLKVVKGEYIVLIGLFGVGKILLILVFGMVLMLSIG